MRFFTTSFPLLTLLLTLLIPACKEKPPVQPVEKVAPTPALSFSGEKAFAHLEKLTSFGPRPSESAGYEKSLAYLESELATLGWKTVRQSFSAQTPVGPVTFTNLLARYAPDSAPDWTRSTAFVVGSHLDSKRYADIRFLGVNDSGSSTAVLLEMARVLTSQKHLASQVELVFFDGEEAMLTNITPQDGLYGSKEYARQLLSRRNRPRAALVLDLVGDPSVPFLLSPESPRPLLEAARRVILDQKLGARFAISQTRIIDDHLPLSQIAGLDSLLIIGDFNRMPYWHTKNDTLENVAPAPLAESGRVALGLLRLLAR
ncbi:MAG: M28 family peptidase [Verrucomicrobiales bacterium]